MAISKVAKALANLKSQMVFVGGAVTALYADSIPDLELRETYDVDLTSIELVNYLKYSQLLEKLAQLGFYPDQDGHAICSLKYQDIAVDIMPSEDGPLGPANRWYKLGFNDLWTRLAGEEEIKILSSPCYLATKFEAFNDRGKDYRTSHDFEDIIFVLDNRSTLVAEVKDARPEIQAFLKSEFKKINDSQYRDELLFVHLDPYIRDERFAIVSEKTEQLANM